MLTNQLHMEETFLAVARLRPHRPTVLLHDRGCLDGKAFCSAAQWAAVVRNYNDSARRAASQKPPLLDLSLSAAAAKEPVKMWAERASTVTERTHVK